ncbi:phage tail tape measure protein [Listeria rustica]|uniref:Phage tail tape measure protein n=1 Tax=Listeria rustica TaxID=2713503 RepID=A0A7W1T602_9LIST|nr:phage tail tape measure protein [Listeria rustica]MBA3926039.1 phage tail tape measure protein [Listeria rustica]
MTKNNALLKLSDNVKLNKNNDAVTAEMVQTKDYYQKAILAEFAAFIPMRAVIYEMDSRLVSHAIYFSKYRDASKVYFFESNAAKLRDARNDATRNKFPQIECLKPDWSRDRFVRVEKGKSVQADMIAPHVIHATARVLEAGVLEWLTKQLQEVKPILWLETDSANFAEIALLLEKTQYQLRQQNGNNAVYTFQEAAPEPVEDHEIEEKILERLDTYKRQIERMKQEYDEELALIQAKQDKKVIVLEEKYRAIEETWVQQGKEQTEKVRQHQQTTNEAKQLVQQMSDALNAERAVNTDLNKHIFSLLEDEKPVLLTMKKRDAQQAKEIKSLKKENATLTRKLSQMTEKYDRLNSTKVIRMMRKYWKLKKSQRLRNET